MKTPVCERLGIEYPIFAFSHCRDVVAAVSKAGGLGVLGAVAFSPEQLEQELKWIDDHVDGKPYGVDTVMPAAYLGKDQGDLGKVDLQSMIPDEHKRFIHDMLARYGVPELPTGQDAWESLLGWSVSAGRAHVEVAMKHPIRLLANALGPPPEDVVERAHGANVLVAALCGSVDQAIKQKEAGVDIIVASGYEAGGHTGDISSLVLVPQVVDAVAPTPVLAAGGIGSGRQMAAALVLGAQGVWTGSLWLATAESDCVPALKEKIIAATSKDTVRSKCLSGKPARQLRTPWTEAWDSKDSPGTLPMPLQWMATSEALTRIYQHAQTKKPGSAELLGTPIGQIVGQINQMKPAREVVRELIEGSIDAVAQASELLGLTDGE